MMDLCSNLADTACAGELDKVEELLVRISGEFDFVHQTLIEEAGLQLDSWPNAGRLDANRVGPRDRANRWEARIVTTISIR